MSQNNLTQKLIIATLLDIRQKNKVYLKSVDKNVVNINDVFILKNEVRLELVDFYTQFLVEVFEQNKQLDCNSNVADIINQLLKEKTSKQLLSLLEDECLLKGIAKTVYVFTPVNILPEQKRLIRKTKFKNSLTIFKVDSSLIGGAQVLKDSQLSDFSWKSKFVQLKNLC